MKCCAEEGSRSDRAGCDGEAAAAKASANPVALTHAALAARYRARVSAAAPCTGQRPLPAPRGWASGSCGDSRSTFPHHHQGCLGLRVAQREIPPPPRASLRRPEAPICRAACSSSPLSSGQPRPVQCHSSSTRIHFTRCYVGQCFLVTEGMTRCSLVTPFQAQSANAIRNRYPHPWLLNLIIKVDVVS